MGRVSAGLLSLSDETHPELSSLLDNRLENDDLTYERRLYG